MRFSRLAIGLALLVILAAVVDWQTGTVILVSASPAHLGLACLAGAASILVSSWRWQFVLSREGRKPPLLMLVRCYWIGRFFSNFLPGIVGGDIFRAVFMTSVGRPVDVMASLIVERLIGFVTLLGLVAAALLFRLGHFGPLSALASGFAGLLVPVVLLLLAGPTARLTLTRILRCPPLPGKQRPDRIRDEIARSITNYLGSWATLLSAFLVSVLFYVVFVLFNLFIIRAVYGSVPLLEIALLVPVITLIAHLPLAPNGLGVAETAFVLLFTQAGLSPETAFAAALLRRLATLAISLPGGALWILERPRQAHRRATACAQWRTPRNS